ncbi:hypothetical protein C4577_01940 [Candidatus Parcubacteria bacterium]|nr:MAG: hypothetical protein C4577_01940 [Candidatus Parcubacteria bacterium]
MSEEYEDLGELVQQAFDKYLLERLPGLMEKHMPLVDNLIAQRINGGYTPELNKEYFNRIQSIVETTVGNYLRVGGGRDIVDSTVLKYLDKKLEEHIESQVKWRVSRFMERIQKKFEEETKGVS